MSTCNKCGTPNVHTNSSGEQQCENCGYDEANDEDTTEGEMWAGYREERAEKKRLNHQRSIQLLKDRGIQFQTMNEGNGHYRLGEWDFWASTGKFINRKTQKQGRGVFNLIKVIENCPH